MQTRRLVTLLLAMSLSACAAESEPTRQSEPPNATTTREAHPHEVHASCTTDEFGITNYSGIIKNIGTEPAGYALEVAFRRGGAVVDTHTTYVDAVPVGGQATFKAGTKQEKGPPVECELVRVTKRP